VRTTTVPAAWLKTLDPALPPPTATDYVLHEVPLGEHHAALGLRTACLSILSVRYWIAQDRLRRRAPMRSPSVACEALVLVVLGATSLGFASCGGGGEAKTVTRLKTVPTLINPPSRRHREKSPALTAPTAPPTAAPRAYSGYSASLYDAEVPQGWQAVEDETSHGEFVRSKWRDPNNPNTSVLIDAISRETTPPEEKAASIRAATSSSPDYSEISFAPTKVAGLAGVGSWRLLWLAGRSAGEAAGGPASEPRSSRRRTVLPPA
jgi:hypothetical protein